MLLVGWISHIVDAKGAFVHGTFGERENVNMKVPEDWEGFYTTNTVLLLVRTIYWSNKYPWRSGSSYLGL
jgi:hypothetical protein